MTQAIELSENSGRFTPAGLEVLRLDPEIVRQIRAFKNLSWGSQRIRRGLGISRGAARRYMRGGDAASTQVRPRARRLSTEQRTLAVELLDGAGAGNAVVVHELLRSRGIHVSLRTLPRALTPVLAERRADETATVRFEREPGHQMQIDFGERDVVLAGRRVRVMFFVAVL